jgi:lipopolysaccharide biosynthesis protein
VQYSPAINRVADGLPTLTNAISIGSVPANSARDTAVVLHLHYPEMWPEIRLLLASLGGAFDLYVTVCDTIQKCDLDSITSAFPAAMIFKLINRGRDVGPFMSLLAVLPKEYKYICKIHTKKSPHRVDGDQWRKRMYGSLLGTAERVSAIKALFDSFPNIGIVAPEGEIHLCSDHPGDNGPRIIELGSRMGLTTPTRLDYDFATGSMFWFTPAALAPLKRLEIAQTDFEIEQGQIDGTLAHALERTFSLSAKIAGFETVGTDILTTLDRYFSDTWRCSQFDDRFLDSRGHFHPLVRCLKILSTRDAEISSLRNSTSWKLTAPLRKLSRIVGWVLR